MTLSEKLLELRTRHGLSQGDLAEKLEVSRQSVSKWETGQSVPDLDKIIKLADLFHVTVDELVREERTAEAGPETERTEKAESPQDAKMPPKLRPVGICFAAAGCAVGVLGLVMRPHATLITLGFLLAGSGIFLLLLGELLYALGAARPASEFSTSKVVYVEKKQGLTCVQTVGVIMEVTGAALAVIGIMGAPALILAAVALVILGLPLLLAKKHPFLILGWLAVAISLVVLNPYTSVSPWGLVGGIKYVWLMIRMPKLNYFTYIAAAAVGIGRGLLTLLLLYFTWQAWKNRRHTEKDG